MSAYPACTALKLENRLFYEKKSTAGSDGDIDGFSFIWHRMGSGRRRTCGKKRFGKGAPLGTNHAFDGWVDKFLTTPANGLIDASIGITYVAKSESPYFDGTKVILAYHDFSAEHGSADYGTEWNALIEQTYDKHYTLGVKVARYESNGLFTDTTKIIPYAQVKF